MNLRYIRFSELHDLVNKRGLTAKFTKSSFGCMLTHIRFVTMNSHLGLSTNVLMEQFHLGNDPLMHQLNFDKRYAIKGVND